MLFKILSTEIQESNLLQIEQKFVAMMLISSAVSQRILAKSGMDNLLGPENNLAKSEFEFI